MSKYWRTRDGETIRIKEMATDHLFNSIRMLTKAAMREKEKALVALMDAADSASNDAELRTVLIKMEYLETTPLEDHAPHNLHVLIEEAKRRGLDPNNPPDAFTLLMELMKGK